MGARDLITSADVKVLGTAKVSIATATTTSFDFGTPDDINLAASGSAYRPGDRIVAVIDLSTAGTTDTTGFVVQDADDSSGSIGTPATAVTSVVSGALAGGTGDQTLVVSVKIQPGRPWLRFRVTRASGTTDTTVAQATILAFPKVV